MYYYFVLDNNGMYNYFVLDNNGIITGLLSAKLLFDGITEDT